MSVLTTPHFGLKKPDGAEAIKPDPFNDNADVIDEKLFEQSKDTGISLSDDAAAALGLTGNPHVADALPALATKIGDLRYSVRTDLGEKWLLCNGAALTEQSYPDLCKMLSSTPDGAYASNTCTTASLNSIAYGNGYYVAVGNSGALCYASSLAGPWIQNTQGTNAFNKVIYANGYWVAVGYSGVLYYKQGTPDGVWTQNTNFGTSTLRDIVYVNDYWVIAAVTSGIYYKQGSPDGSWTNNAIGNIYSVTYANDYWVAAGNNGTVLYKQSTSPDGTWTPNNQGTNTFFTIVYGNGYWVAAGYSGNVYYKQGTPDGTWTQNTSLGYAYSIVHVVYANGFWAFTLQGYSQSIYYKALTPDGTWTQNSSNSSSWVFNQIYYLEGYWVAVGNNGLVCYKSKLLPTISVPGAYAYIKALL